MRALFSEADRTVTPLFGGLGGAGGAEVDEALVELKRDAMGDVVLGELIKVTPAAQQAVEARLKKSHALDVFVVIADEARRNEALGIVQQLREGGWRTDYPLTPQKIGKQFQHAEAVGARFAAIVGAEYPMLVVKNLATRDQMEVPTAQLREKLAELFAGPEYKNLIA